MGQPMYNSLVSTPMANSPCLPFPVFLSLGVHVQLRSPHTVPAEWLTECPQAPVPSPLRQQSRYIYPVSPRTPDTSRNPALQHRAQEKSYKYQESTDPDAQH